MPITFENKLRHNVKVRVYLVSPKLLFPLGDAPVIELPPGRTTLRDPFVVEARTSGTFPMTIELRSVRNIGYANAEAIAKRILALFDEGAFDIATLFFSRFRSVIAQIPTAQQIIPPVFEAKESGNGAAASYEYEPDEVDILDELLPTNIAVQVFRALLENAASEQGARMSAMDNATRNAGEMIRKQTLTYNRTRQAMITKELIEIISGAEAL